jgi:hypothetical protein
MTPATARRIWKRAISAHGETITLRRTNPSPAAPTSASVRARVMGFAPEELVGGINQGDRKVFILAEDVESAGFPTPIRAGSSDRILVRGKTLMIQSVDESSARIGDTLIAYELRVTGA